MKSNERIIRQEIVSFLHSTRFQCAERLCMFNGVNKKFREPFECMLRKIIVGVKNEDGKYHNGHFCGSFEPIEPEKI